MWSVKCIEGQNYLYSLKHNLLEHLHLFISNFEESWITELTSDEIVNIAKKMNPLFEAERETLIIETIALFKNSRSDVCWSVVITQNQLKLNLKSAYSGLPFQFDVTLQQVNSKQHFSNIVLPLLIIIKNLQYQNEYLCDCIKKKDKEIKEYKLEGAMLSRRTVETVQFDQNVLDNMFCDNLKSISFKLLEDLFDDTVISYFNEISKYPSRLEEKQNVKISENMKGNYKKVYESGLKLEMEKPNYGNSDRVITKPVVKRTKPVLKNKPKLEKKLRNL